jgi:hypothetical protein
MYIVFSLCVDTIFIETKNRIVQLANGAHIELRIDNPCHQPEIQPDNLLPVTLFFRPPSEKKRASHQRSGRVYG